MVSMIAPLLPDAELGLIDGDLLVVSAADQVWCNAPGLLGGIVEHRGLPDPAAAVEDRCIAEIHFFTGLYHRDRLNRRLDRYLHRLDCSRLLHDRGHRYLWLGLRRCLYHRLHDRGRLSGDRKARCAAPLLHTRNRKTLALCRLIGGPFGLCGLAWFRGRLLGLTLLRRLLLIVQGLILLTVMGQQVQQRHFLLRGLLRLLLRRLRYSGRYGRCDDRLCGRYMDGSSLLYRRDRRRTYRGLPIGYLLHLHRHCGRRRLIAQIIQQLFEARQREYRRAVQEVQDLRYMV